MTHDDALAHAEELNRQEQGDRHWFPRRRGADAWEVVAVAGTGAQPNRPLGERTEARPEPRTPSDPRPSIVRNVPPYGGG